MLIERHISATFQSESTHEDTPTILTLALNKHEVDPDPAHSQFALKTSGASVYRISGDQLKSLRAVLDELIQANDEAALFANIKRNRAHDIKRPVRIAYDKFVSYEWMEGIYWCRVVPCSVCGKLPIARATCGGNKTTIGCDNNECEIQPSVTAITPHGTTRIWNNQEAAGRDE